MLQLNFIRCISRSSGSLHNVPKTLLPPLTLYRHILRAHSRNLPALQKSLGDEYVKSEFKLHRSVENPLHIVGFLASWQDYLKIIDNGSWQEGTLSKETFEKMSPDQVVQLYELMKESERVRDGKSENSDPKGSQ